MEIHLLRTLVAVAHEGSITRAADRLYLSQPAVSAHIKAIEDTVGLPLFERTPRGMSLTREGQRLLTRAEQILDAHRELMEEATRIKGSLTGKLRLGAAASANSPAISRLLAALAERCPDVELTLQHGTSAEIQSGICSGRLDAGFYHEAGEPEADLTILEVARFGLYLAAPPGLLVGSQPDWEALAELPWIGPTASSCCGRAAERLFRKHRIQPRRIINIDREEVTRALISGGIGVGFLHAATATEAQRRGEVQLVCEVRETVRVLFAYLSSRGQDPLLSAVSSIVRTGLS